MHWYQLQQLGQWAQWTPELLRNIETIDVTIDADTSDITEASVNWLHQWATSVTHTRRLRCVIPRWTVAIQRGFARSKNRIGMHTWNVNGLIGFDLVIESLDPQLMQNTRWVLDRDLMQGEMIWGRFVSMNTHITLSFHARKVDPWTMQIGRAHV